MKKLLFLALTSLNLLCLGTAVRIKLVARDGQCVMLMGESDEQTGAITTPFDFVNTFFQFADCEMVQVLRENQAPLWELRQEINFPDIDPAILRQAVQGVSPDSGFDINQLDQPTITQLINVYDFLQAPQGVIDVLINRSVELAIADPAHCPFGAITRLPNSVNDREIISALNHVVAARRRVDELFGETVLPDNPWQSRVLAGHQGGVHSVAWSPDGQHVATGSRDHTARIWDAETRELAYTLEGHTETVNSAVFSPDGQHVATGSSDNTARIWRQEWNWDTSVTANDQNNLLRKLLMLKVARNQELTPAEVNDLLPMLPESARAWVDREQERNSLLDAF